MIGQRHCDEKSPHIQELAPNLTPLLDVLFMLLIFLVLTANTAQYALDLALPQTSEPGSSLQIERQVVISLPRAGEAIIVDNVALVGWDRAQAFIAQRIQAEPDAKYVIAGDRDVPFQNVVRALSFLRSKNVAKVHILVQQE